MARYFYAWLPLVLVGTIVILACPWLALIALAGALLAVVSALGALAVATFGAFRALGRAAFGSVPLHSPELSESLQPVVLNEGHVARGLGR
jgi:hypothetical protein